MDKDDLRYKAELCLIGGWAKKKLECVKNGRVKGLLKKLKKATHVEISKLQPVHGDLDMVFNVIKKFTHDTGWENKDLPTGTHVSFCKAIIAQNERPFGKKIEKILDDIDDYYDRKNNLKYDYFVSADIACQKWLTILGIHDDEKRDSKDILRMIDGEIARENAFIDYKEQFYKGDAK